MADTARRLEIAISRGAPAYNRGEVRRCAEIYVRAAREELERTGSDLVRREIAPAVASAEARLAGGGAASASRRRNAYDLAAWELRHAFDAVLIAHARSRPSVYRQSGCALS